MQAGHIYVRHENNTPPQITRHQGQLAGAYLRQRFRKRLVAICKPGLTGLYVLIGSFCVFIKPVFGAGATEFDRRFLLPYKPTQANSLWQFTQFLKPLGVVQPGRKPRQYFRKRTIDYSGARIPGLSLFACANCAVFLFLFSSRSFAQPSNHSFNYVLNPGFEKHSACPFEWNQIKYANYWTPIDTLGDPNNPFSLPMGSAEFCHMCAGPNIYCGSPSNVYFHHYPRTDSGMIQAQMYSDETTSLPYHRDYVQGRLFNHLTSGVNYTVTFFVTAEFMSVYATNRIGAYIDDGSIDVGQDSLSCALAQTAFTPQVVENEVITDTVNWTKIQGCFTANGTERFITIGNFSDKSHTSAVSLTGSYYGGYSWYLIDDVSIIETNKKITAGDSSYRVKLGDSVFVGSADEAVPCDWYKGSLDAGSIGHGAGIWLKGDALGSCKYYVVMNLCNSVSIDSTTLHVYPVGVPIENLNAKAAIIYPNPATSELTIENAGNCEIKIFNLLGQQELKKNITENKEPVAIGNLATGSYLLQVTDKAGIRQNLRFTKQ